MTMKVAVLDDYQNAARQFGDWSALEQRIQLTIFRDHLDDEEAVVARLAPFDVVCMMRERTRLTGAMLARLPNLKLIVTTAMVNAALDQPAAVARGITVCGTGAVMTGTPELVWALLLGLARRLPAEHRAVRSGSWQTGVGKDLNDAMIGIVGLGRIGSRVARVADAFRMKVQAWSPNLTDQRATECGAARVDKQTLFRTSDFIVIAMQLRQSTRHLAGAAEIGLMKPTAFLINTSRGELIDDEALIAALASGRIAGAGLDTFDKEPLPADHPYRRLDNVIATPHIGYVTEATYRQFFAETIEDIAAWLDGKPIRLVTQNTMDQ